MIGVVSKSRVPVGGYWKWKCHETNVILKHPYYDELLKLAVKHLNANNFPVGSNFRNDFEANVCQQMPESCEEKRPDLLSKAEQLTHALLKFARSGFKVASDEVVASRYAICQSCEFWIDGGRILTGTCKVCGCGGAKLWLPLENCPKNKWRSV